MNGANPVIAVQSCKTRSYAELSKHFPAKADAAVFKFIGAERHKIIIWLDWCLISFFSFFLLQQPGDAGEMRDQFILLFLQRGAFKTDFWKCESHT